MNNIPVDDYEAERMQNKKKAGMGVQGKLLEDSMGNVNMRDSWCDHCFEYISDCDVKKHKNSGKCRPILPSIEALERNGEIVDKVPYTEEKIFKVSKAITNHLAEVLKTKEGLFSEINAIENLKTL